jgi:hypothetical protein
MHQWSVGSRCFPAQHGATSAALAARITDQAKDLVPCREERQGFIFQGQAVPDLRRGLSLVGLDRRHAFRSTKDFGIGPRLHEPRLSRKLHCGYLAPRQSNRLFKVRNRDPVQRTVTPALLNRRERRADGDEYGVVHQRAPRSRLKGKP